MVIPTVYSCLIVCACLACYIDAFTTGLNGILWRSSKTVSTLNMPPLLASRCGRHKELYWKLRVRFDTLRDKSKRKPRELEYEFFAKWSGLAEMSEEERQELWLKCVKSKETPATFRQFLKICDELNVDEKYEAAKQPSDSLE